MARSIKYYSTIAYMVPSAGFRAKYNYTKRHNQFDVVCKATSRAEANRIMASLGFETNFFRPNYSSDCANERAMQAADMYGVAFCTAGTFGAIYVPMSELKI